MLNALYRKCLTFISILLKYSRRANYTYMLESTGLMSGRTIQLIYRLFVVYLGSRAR